MAVSSIKTLHALVPEFRGPHRIVSVEDARPLWLVSKVWLVILRRSYSSTGSP